MADRTLIVARIKPADALHIGDLFAESDAGELPKELGVRRRHLFSYHNLYFHYVEFDGNSRAALHKASGRHDFADLSEKLQAFVTPYDPKTWQSPADAQAAEFYSWTPEDGVQR